MLKGQIVIYIKTLTGIKFDLIIYSDDTIESIKAKIQDELGIPFLAD